MRSRTGMNPSIQTEFSIETADGLNLRARWWPAGDDPRGVVAVIHGAAEHIGRYDAFAGALNRRGFAVTGFDMRGHGRSDGRRLFVRSFDRLVDDAARLLARITEIYPGRPLFLFGHSTGGTVATLLALTHPVQLESLILSGPLLKVGENFSPLTIRLAKLLGRFAPRLPLDRIDASHVSRDEDVVQDYEADPLVYHGRIPAGTGAAGIRAIQQIEQEESSLRLPILILHGTADKLADVDGSRRLYRRAASTDKTLKLYEGFYHEVLKDLGKEKVLADLLIWLEERARRAG